MYRHFIECHDGSNIAYVPTLQALVVSSGMDRPMIIDRVTMHSTGGCHECLRNWYGW